MAVDHAIAAAGGPRAVASIPPRGCLRRYAGHLEVTTEADPVTRNG
ncbi:hypothetical protein GJR88_00889 [Dietzia sp. DQ12-45-1b]|nr:hypothetical protein GJR88_00889 [Dietzia sp. DQ12-45-1b]